MTPNIRRNEQPETGSVRSRNRLAAAALRLSLLLAALAVSILVLPATALAVEGAPNSLYVGNQGVIRANTVTYWTTDNSGGLTRVDDASDDTANWNVKYDPGTATLTLNGATITGSSYSSVSQGAGIYALCSNGNPVSLTIELIGENTITGYYGIYVDADIDMNSNGGTDASLTITGENNGSLEVSGSNNGIFVISGTGDASLNINDASVAAKTTQTYSGYAGVCVQSGASATTSPNISLSVNGGSLTASGTESSDGILFYVGSSQATGATTSLTVSENAIVDARNGGISAFKILETLPTPTPTGDNRSGIVFDGSAGTVYGKVNLDESLTINQGETLTIPEGSSLDASGKLTNEGTINVESGGTVSGNLSDGSTVTTPSISQQPTGQTVTEGQAATFTVEASAGSETPTYQWQQKTAASGSDWTDINSATSDSYTTEATTTSMSGYQYRCVVKSASGVSVISQAATLTVNQSISPTSYSISADVAPAGAGTVTVNGSGTSASVAAGNDVTLAATANEGYRFTGWTSSGGGTFVNASSESTTFIMPASDVTVTAQFAKVVTGVTLDKETLELFTDGSATLTAAVEPSDATNKNLTWSSSDGAVATVNNGTVTAVGAGETTITVQTQDGNYTATCKVTVTQSTYSISADTTALNFGSVYTGYAQPAARTVTITNTGNQTQPLTLTASTGSFEVGTLTKTQLAAGEKATFTVQPKAGLAVGTYSENITVSGTGGATVTITASFTVKQYSSGGGTPTKTPSQQAVDKIESAKDGSTVEIKLSTGSTKLDKEVFEELAGRDVTLEISLSNGVTWTVNGQDIPENADLTDLDMGVSLNTSTIPVNLINSVTGEAGTVQLTLKHDGPFGFKATLVAPMGEDAAGMYGNLYRYDGDAEALDFEASGMVDEDGTARLAFDHASLWLIALDTRSHALPFADTGEDLWYSEAVRWAWRHGVMTGYADGSGSFGTNDSLTRAQMAAVLYNMAGKPDADMSGLPGDCDGGAWYATCVSWALETGVFNGYGDGSSFGPDDPLTREQAACVLMNAASVLGADVSARADLSAFPDADEVSPWASDALSWAVAEGVLSGVETADGARELQPTRACARAEMAALMMNLSARSAE